MSQDGDFFQPFLVAVWVRATHGPGDQGDQGAERREIRIDGVRVSKPLHAGDEGVTVAVTGQNLQDAVQVRFGEGVDVKDFKVAETGQLMATLIINKKATPGPRKMEVWNKDSHRFEKDNAIAIVEEKLTPAADKDTEKPAPTSGSTKRTQKKR